MDVSKKITFVRFCFASASMLQEDLGLPTEKLVYLYKECTEMAKHCDDIGTMMGSCMRFVVLSNSIGRHTDSLRCLKEILPSTVVIPSYELTVHQYLFKTYLAIKEFDKAALHAKKWTEISRNIGNKENEIHGYYHLGNVFLFLCNYDRAIDCGKKIIEIDDTEGGSIMAYHCLTLAYRYMQKYDDTILFAQKLLDCAIKVNDQKIMMTAYEELGGAHHALNHQQDAIDYVKKFLVIARDTGYRCGELWAYRLMGQAYNALSDYDNAIIYCKKCIELAITIGDKRAEAYAYSVLGSIYHSLGKYDDAISNCNKCLQIDEEDTEGKDSDVIAYLSLGKVNHSLKKYDEAIQNFKQCIDIVKSIGREKKELIAAFLHLGTIYLTLKQYDDAVHYYKKCIDMAQETGEKMTEAEACLGLIRVYLTLDEKDYAIHYCKKCIDISQATEDKRTEMNGHYLLAQIYMGLVQLNDAFLSIDAGMAFATELGDKVMEADFKLLRSYLDVHVGLLDKASDVPPACSEDQLKIDVDQAVKTGDKINKHRASIKLYRFYLSKEEHENAIHCLEQLKEMDVDLSVNLFCFREIGRLYQTIGQNDMALRCLKEGLPTAETCSDNMQLSQFYYCISELLYLLNRELNLAERYLRKAIRCFEAIYATLGSRDEFKISIFHQYIDSYKLLAMLLITGKQNEEALLVLDRCRARALKDEMVSNFKMNSERSNEEHLECNDSLTLVVRNDFNIFYYALCFNTFLKFFWGNTSLRLSINSSVMRLLVYVDMLFDEMGVREPVVNCEDRSLDYKEDIQKERQTRCIEDHEGLNQATASLLNLDSKGRESNENRAESKGSIHGVLFQILECDKILSLKQEEVVIIPEGPLYQVPFPALRDPSTGKYLSETRRIRLAPSMATLKHFEDFPSDQTSSTQPLIIGDPLVGKVIVDGKERYIISLPGARKEAAKISLLLNTLALLEEHATKPAVIKRLQEGASVVHIAAHGILSKATILLAPSPEIRATKIPDEEDYMLTMADVQQAKVRAQLVVLSCCHSGRGEIRAEGVVGMCRAFLVSGARAVVASLWAIEDSATLAFMTIFYGHLKNGESASTSLQLTMNEMRNATDYKEPKFWAPFFLMGDDVTLKL